jgi:CDP-glycerol glycerophosphotransferase (TagB/SpsB family)
MRIGVLLNHDQIHQAAHCVPIAAALHRRGIDVTVITTSEALGSETARLAELLGAAEIPIVELRLRRVGSRIAAALFDRVLPAAKLAIYGDNVDIFAGFDALIVAEKTSAILKTRYRLDQLKLVHTRHGAGDRAIGFDKASSRFDLVLVSGAKIYERLRAEAGVRPEKMAVVGYPKFDLLALSPPSLPFARNGRPTVLYNPHVSPHLSSWYRQGRAVLDHFLRDDRYNLIFAPHVMLFQRRFVLSIEHFGIDRPGGIERRYYDAPNIHIDLGSRASTDMSYTAAADIYLGDVSSQVYEFLQRPRPCLFLNSHRVDWRNDPNYTHWQAGDVIEDIADLGPAIDAASSRHQLYRPIQRQLFSQSFELDDRPSSERAADAILAFLNEAPQSAPLRQAVSA